MYKEKIKRRPTLVLALVCLVFGCAAAVVLTVLAIQFNWHAWQVAAITFGLAFVFLSTVLVIISFKVIRSLIIAFNQVDDLKKETVEIRNSIEVYKETISINNKTESESISKKIDFLKMQLSDQILSLQSAMESSAAQSSDLHHTLAQLDGRLIAQDYVVQELDKKTRQLDKLLPSLDQQLCRLDSENSALTDRLSTIADQLAQLDHQTSNTASEISDLQEKLDSEVSALTDRLPTIADQLAQLDDQASFAASEISSHKDWLDAAQQQISQVYSMVSGVDNKISAEADNRESLLLAVRDAIRNGRFSPTFQKSVLFDPEVDLIEPLAKAVTSKTAIDVGANRGEFTAALRRHGFSVHAFEPNPELIPNLKLRFDGDTSIHIHACAAGNENRLVELKIASSSGDGVDKTLFGTVIDHPSISSLKFDSSITVPQRLVNDVLNLKKKCNFGIFKIDTEGFDLSVLSGASLVDADALLVEYWDAEHPFNQGQVENTLSDYLNAIDHDLYGYCILMWRGFGEKDYGLIANPKITPPGSWGSLLFLKDESTYQAVLRHATKIYGLDHVSDPMTQLSEASG